MFSNSNLVANNEKVLLQFRERIYTLINFYLLRRNTNTFKFIRDRYTVNEYNLNIFL